MKFPVSLPLALFITSLHAEEQPYLLRVLTVGNRAPFQQVVRDGVRYEVDPPEGSLPPRRVAVGAAGAEMEGDQAEDVVTLRLGEISAPVTIPASGDSADSPPMVVLRDGDSGGLWLKAPLLPDPRTLLVVWRVGKEWSQVKFLPLAESSQALPKDSTRVINVTPGDVGVTWAGEKILLKAGKHVRLDFPTGAEAGHLLIQYAAGGKPVTAIDTMVENSPGTLRQWIVFKADRPDARQPVQVLPLAEPR